MKNMRNRKLSDASIVAALLMANVPGLAEKYPESGVLRNRTAAKEHPPEQKHTLREYHTPASVQGKLV